jgi:hypothetical protein
MAQIDLDALFEFGLLLLFQRPLSDVLCKLNDFAELPVRTPPTWAALCDAVVPTSFVTG